MPKIDCRLIALVLLATGPVAFADDPPAAEPALGLSVPPGFEVSLYADDDLAHDIYSMTFDSHGRVVVAGAGYIKTLHDDDGDGRADRATLFSDVPKSGAHGLCFDGNDLICTGDDCLGRLRDADGDGRADGPLEPWARLRHSEHGANGVVRGPDGWFYVICGNDAGVSEEHVKTEASPVQHPRCGAVVRFSPDGKLSEVYAHGFRNPYDLDFTAEGHLLTVDSDNEREHHLPWYAPTRLFDVAQGQEHGWLQAGWQNSWNRPESWFDNVERLCEIGRGSPTGLVVYRHTRFPQRYRGGCYSACWSLGRVYYFPLARHEASYQTELEIFLQTTGDVGFAPTDLAVSPAGELFVSIGGRGTRGGVFQVSYRGGVEEVVGKAEGSGRRRAAHGPPRERRQSLTKLVQGYTRDQLVADGILPLDRTLKSAFGSTASVIEGVRMLQLALGDVRIEDESGVFVGYEVKSPGEVPEQDRKLMASCAAAAFSTAESDDNRELARLLAMVEADVPNVPQLIAQHWSDESTPEDDIHYLICLARLPTARTQEVTRQTAHALARLHRKMLARGYHPSRNWPLRVGECFDELLKKDPALAAAVVDAEDFGLADHALFAARMPDEIKQRAARKLLAAAQAAEEADEDAPAWTAELVGVVAALPAEEALPALRAQWDDYTLRDAIALELAKQRRPEDRARLREALQSTQADVIVAAAEALATYEPPAAPEELAAALGALRQYAGVPQQRAVRLALGKLLAAQTGQGLPIDEPADADVGGFWQPWFAWFEEEYPDAAASLSAATGADFAAWKDRLGAIDWVAGRAEQGKLIFERRQCQRCHRGTSKLGPDLAGAAARFSREDLFAAIVEPSRDVAPTYRTSAVVTRDGRVYVGLLVYESPNATLVQTGPDVTVRVSGEEFAGIQPSRQSLMPTGLLNECTDQDLADLDAYLRTLTPAGQ